MRPVYRRTPGDWLADLGATLMIILLAIVCVALLSGCGDVGTNGLTPRTYSEPLKMTATEVNVTFVFAHSPDEVTSWCSARGLRAPPAGSYTTGCAIRPQSKFNPTDRWTIYAVRPTSWNDQPSLANLGHEVAHTLGGKHE